MSEKWDRRFLDLAAHVAQWSKDPSTKVGSVIVQPNLKMVVGLGYNGFARGVEDTEERLVVRELKYKFVVHAEVNALIMAGERARGATMYNFPAFVTPPICHDCCKTAIQFGIKEVVGFVPDIPEELRKRWEESIGIARQMCQEAGVTYREIIR